VIGTLIGHYRIVERLGAGGMGVVYKAEDLHLGRVVALKFLPPETMADRTAAERFRREARAASALNHPNICTIHDFGEHDNRQYLVMELLEGRTLQAAIADRPLPIEDAVRLAIDLADALDAAHARHIVHRDIKPGNVFITTRGDAKLLDFGLARELPRQIGPTAATASGVAEVTTPGAMLGTLPYMSPEQARGERVDARSDLFSFGAVLFEMVTGVAAFRGETAPGILEAVLSHVPPAPVRFNPRVPAELERIVAKALEKDPAMRYQSAADMRADLRRLHRDTTGALQPPRSEPVTSTSDSGIRRWALGGVALIGMLAIAFFPHSRGSAPALTEKDTVLIADFENTTGDAVFDGTLKQALAINVEQSPYFNVFPEQRVRETLELMRRSPDDRVTRALAREICERHAITAMLVGSIAPLGSNYVVTLEAISARSGDTLARAQVQATAREDVLNALGRGAGQLRRRLGESVASLERFDQPLQEATTSSLEALRLYSEARSLAAAGRFADAVPLYRRATEQDPEFAIAFGGLAVASGNQPGRNDGTARRAAARAFELRDRVTERERYALTHYYLMRVEGDVLKARENMEVAVRAYPRYYSFRTLLTYMYVLEGKYPEAVEQGEESRRLAAGPIAVVYSNHGWALRAMGRYAEAKKIFAEAHAKKVDHQTIHYNLLLIAFAEGDRDGIQRQIAWARGKPAEGGITLRAMLMELFQGRRPADVDALSAGGEIAASYAALGDCAGATAIVARMPPGDAVWARPVPLALCGDLEKAARAVAELGALTSDGDASNRELIVSIAGALIEHARGNFVQAREKLQPALGYQMGQLDGFWTTYVLALTYLGERRPVEAIVEFERILGRRSVDPASPLYPLSHLGVARAAGMAGDTTRARKAYEALFAIWHDADGDLPAVVAGRSEHGR
jgi:serine/threonine protein kinase/Flp pilus assembly protein TadD